MAAMLSDERHGLHGGCAAWWPWARPLVGCVLTVLLPNGTSPAWVGNMLVNLLFLLIYSAHAARF